jgi:hypothetical protein
MPGAITIPAETVPLVRTGVYADLRDTTGETHDLLGSHNCETNAGRYALLFGREAEARALLDMLGWEATHAPEPVQVPDAHRVTLLRAVREQIEHHDYVIADEQTHADERAEATTCRELLVELFGVAGGDTH